MLAAARMRLAVNQKPPLSTFCQTTCERYISQLAPPSSSSNLKKLIPHRRAVLSRPLLSIFGPLSDFHLDDGRYDDANPFRCLIDAANLLACTCRPRLDLSDGIANEKTCASFCVRPSFGCPHQKAHNLATDGVYQFSCFHCTSLRLRDGRLCAAPADTCRMTMHLAAKSEQKRISRNQTIRLIDGTCSAGEMASAGISRRADDTPSSAQRRHRENEKKIK